jgi:hypothetical protein
MMGFLTCNILFEVLKNNTKWLNIIVYAQIVIMFLMMLHVIVSWSYSLYLSFFENEILNNIL